MKPRTTKEMAIAYAAVVAVVLIITVAFTGHTNAPPGDKGLSIVVGLCVVGLGLILGYRYLSTRNQARMELTEAERYRGLAEEYRRLADLAITAQEHTDLKLGEVSVQLDHLRAQVDSLRKILSEVE